MDIPKINRFLFYYSFCRNKSFFGLAPASSGFCLWFRGFKIDSTMLVPSDVFSRQCDYIFFNDYDVAYDYYKQTLLNVVRYL